MYTLEWIIWAFFTFVTLVIFASWLKKKGEYRPGHIYNSDEVLALKALPKIAFIESIILTIFLFIEYSKLHLLWIYPIIYFGIQMYFAKKMIKKGNIY